MVPVRDPPHRNIRVGTANEKGELGHAATIVVLSVAATACLTIHDYVFATVVVLDLDWSMGIPTRAPSEIASRRNPQLVAKATPD